MSQIIAQNPKNTVSETLRRLSAQRLCGFGRLPSLPDFVSNEHEEAELVKRRRLLATLFLRRQCRPTMPSSTPSPLADTALSLISLDFSGYASVGTCPP